MSVQYKILPFKDFIRKILVNRCMLKEKTVDTYFLNSFGMKLIETSFTHKSLNALSYEPMEARGDPIFNACITEWIATAHPEIVSAAWISRLHSNLKSEKYLSYIAHNIGFGSYTKYSPEYYVLSDNPMEDDEYKSMIADNMEALCGAIMGVCQQKPLTRGIGFTACSNMIFSFLYDLGPLDLTYEGLYDPKSRLKNLGDEKGWSANNLDINKVLIVVEITDNSLRRFSEDIIIMKNVNNQKIDLSQKFMALAYKVSDNGKSKRIAVINTGSSKNKLDMKTATDMLEIYKKMGIVGREKKLTDPESKYKKRRSIKM